MAPPLLVGGVDRSCSGNVIGRDKAGLLGLPSDDLPRLPSRVTCTSSGAVTAQMMMTASGEKISMTIRQIGFGLAVSTLIAFATPAKAVTEIQWWHAMTGGNNNFIVKLADDFNAS